MEKWKLRYQFNITLVEAVPNILLQDVIWANENSKDNQRHARLVVTSPYMTCTCKYSENGLKVISPLEIGQFILIYINVLTSLRLTHMFSFWQASDERKNLTQGFEEPWKTLPTCFPCWTCDEFWKRNCLHVINYQQIPPEAEPFSFQESYSITQFNMSLMPVT